MGKPLNQSEAFLSLALQIILLSIRLIIGKYGYSRSHEFPVSRTNDFISTPLPETLRVHCILQVTTPFREPHSLCHNILTISMPITRPLVYPHKHKHSSLTFEIFRAIICWKSRPDFQVLGQEWRRGQRCSCWPSRVASDAGCDGEGSLKGFHREKQ